MNFTDILKETISYLCISPVFLEYQGLEIEYKESFGNVNYNYDLPPKKKISYTLNSLKEINFLINQFLILIDDEPNEDFNIEGDFNEYVNAFKKSYRREFFETSEWEHFYDYFFLFDEWLTEIKSLNDEIIFQNVRMKRDTRTETVKLLALCKEFLNKYSEFKMLT